MHNDALAHPALVSAARGLTHLGDPLVVTIATFAVAAALVVARRRPAAVYLLLVRALALLTTTGLKVAVDRPRPVLEHPLAHPHGASFPSGHALGTAALWASVAVVLAPRLAPAVAAFIGAAVPVVVAATRVELGLHFVTDVVAGLLLGWLLAVVGAYLLDPDRPRTEARAAGPDASP